MSLIGGQRVNLEVFKWAKETRAFGSPDKSTTIARKVRGVFLFFEKVSK